MSNIKEFEHLIIPLEAIKSATNNFGGSNYIGKGGFGKVYRGELSHHDGQSMVAVKRLDRAFGQGDPEFLKEIMMLSRYKHQNLISLLGFCDESDERLLVYEHASRGSLNHYLSNVDLTWIQRLNICVGAARGLEYLHNPKGTQHRVLHRDIKSSNILLDENWEAKILDFGLSKIGPANQPYTFIVSNVVGTFGYCDPLYMETCMLTKESDVYSFGVVLFEVLCGRLCISNHSEGSMPLTGLARRSYENNKLDEIIFNNLKHQIDPNSLNRFTTIAYQCLKRDRQERPTMTMIVKELEITLESQLAVRYDFGKWDHGCNHYRRRCKLRAPCCSQIFSCRRCHDEYTSTLSDPIERHKIVSHDVEQVVCMICNTEQKVAHICKNCGVKMGEYFCAICKFYDDDTSKQQFHCDDCGICRIYGRHNYFHCHKCGCCMSINLLGNHTCIENSIKNKCPTCHEYLFDSVKEIKIMSCGHMLHLNCYRDMESNDLPAVCPICSKFIKYAATEELT